MGTARSPILKKSCRLQLPQIIVETTLGSRQY